jgi:hypothetical protein
LPRGRGSRGPAGRERAFVWLIRQPSHLLRRHVLGRPHRRAGETQGVRAKITHHPEVEELYHLARGGTGEEHVAGFEVTVHKPASVGVGQRVGETARERAGLANSERAPCKTGRQVLAIEPFHRKKRPELTVDAVAHMTHDAGVLECGKRGTLTNEALPARLLCDQFESNIGP